MKHSLRTRLSFTFALVVLITVALISFLSNFFIEEQFKSYITRQQQQKSQYIISSISLQFSKSTNTWNKDFIHTIGMSALYDGYIVKVYNIKGDIIWDAQAHDMSLCADIMEDISERMKIRYPEVNGEFTSKVHHLTNNNEIIGSVNISYFGPYFLSENDFEFLGSLNTILVSLGFFSLLFSVVISILMARRLSRPILKTVEATRLISDGKYEVRLDEKTNIKEIDKLILSINQLACSLEKQEDLRQQLTEDVSHELRTPIAILHSHIEAMIDGVWQPTLDRLQSCHVEITRIGKLVSDLENLAKIDSDNLKLNKVEFDILENTNDALNCFKDEIDKKNLHVTVNGHTTKILADKDRISQVMVNLLSNAIKHTDNGGKINLEIKNTQYCVVVRVCDNGIGIPENELQFIFERFYRADKSRNRKTGGSGIGLAIVKSIVEAHGGTVTVESQINRGSCFEVTLPN